jgi:tetratricopeptide (TPR) repeat protein
MGRFIEDWVIANSGRPAYFTKKRPIEGAPGTKMMADGILYRAIRADEVYEPQDYWSEYVWHTLDEAHTCGEYSAELILADYHFFRGLDAFAGERAEDGLREFATALRIAGESKESLNNIGSACAEHGEFDAAMAHYEKALSIDPDYDLVLRNLGKVYIQQNRHEDALVLFERILAKKQEDHEANWLRVRCLKAIGRADDALGHLQDMTEFASEDTTVYREMGMIYLNDKHDAQKAMEMFMKSLEQDPNQPDLAMLIAQLQQGPGRAHQPPTPDLSIPGTGPRLPGVPDLPQIPLPELPSVPRR